MPLYEYQCDACGHRFEKIQKFSDALESVCPKCGGAVRKLMSSPAIQFKGSGFYITDYGKKDSGKESGSEAKAETKAKAEAKADGQKSEPVKTETKPAAAKETKTEKPAATEKSTPAKTD
jgi:putative FmdB family regulatory protein